MPKKGTIYTGDKPIGSIVEKKGKRRTYHSILDKLDG